ncbi:MAG: hypothetical protein ACR2N3_05725 [Pyrinomonadaceae bacterium]
MKHIIFAAINVTVVLFLCFTVYSQNSENKITPQEKQEVEKFVNSFMQSYYQTLDLNKVPDSFFVGDYKKREFHALFIKDFDKLLTNDEKFQNYFTFLDFFSLTLITKLDENNYDLKKTFNNSDNDKADNVDNLFPKKVLSLLQKYPKAKLLLYKENFSQVKNVDDYRGVMRDYRSIVQELRESITTETKIKFSEFLAENKDKFFKLADSFECSKNWILTSVDNCDGFPEKTKMFYYEGLPFSLLMIKDNGRLKIVKVEPPTD